MYRLEFRERRARHRQLADRRRWNSSRRAQERKRRRRQAIAWSPLVAAVMTAEGIGARTQPRTACVLEGPAAAAAGRRRWIDALQTENPELEIPRERFDC